MVDVDWLRWEAAAAEEFRFLVEDCGVFEAVDHRSLPGGAKLLGGRFVFRRKQDKQGKVTSFKARLVAQGFSQRPGVDFHETFAPVAKFVSIRTIVALAARHGLLLAQADVDKAYLHGDLAEDLYMKVPEGVLDPALQGKVLKLHKSLYSLKHAGCVWNHRINATLPKLDYIPTVSNHCVYCRQDQAGWHYIALCVDNLLFASSAQTKVDRVKGALHSKFGIKDLGEAEFILGIQVQRHPTGQIFLSQQAYLKDVLARFNMTECRTKDTPMDSGIQLEPSKVEAEPELKRTYLQAIGSLLYATLGTRPDLAFAVGYLGRFAGRPTDAHWAAIQHVLRYIKGTLDLGILYSPDDRPMTGYSAYLNSDWGGCVTTSRSTAGFAFCIAGGAVSWSSKVQSHVAELSTEAEYLALSSAANEAIFLSQLLGELGYPPPTPPIIFGDNQGAIALSKNLVFAGRLRHLRLKEHAIRERVAFKELSVSYISTDQMVANTFTKAPPRPLFLQHRLGLGVCALPT